MNNLHFLIISGLSGAGKTRVLQSLEDLGYFCVDNLPPGLIPKFAELCSQPENKLQRVALVIDVRGGEFFDSLSESLEYLEDSGFPYKVLFLEADDETLVRRYKETRRRHPLAQQGSVLEGIREERARLQELRGRATWIIDTTDLTPQKLREQIVGIFSRDEDLQRMIITLVSFGFKHGLPLDADLIFDVRFLPNPHYVEALRPLDGNNEKVRDYVLKWPAAQKFLRRLQSLIEFLLPHYEQEGKSQLTIGIGCTGGRHRSVVISEHLAEWLRGKGSTVLVEHRDISREPVGAEER
ncbi:MAG TPA: RNase adapter RapZ [Bacillota bacterium]